MEKDKIKKMKTSKKVHAIMRKSEAEVKAILDQADKDINEAFED